MTAAKMHICISSFVNSSYNFWGHLWMLIIVYKIQNTCFEVAAAAAADFECRLLFGGQTATSNKNCKQKKEETVL
jgi:hypothetical protein